MIPSRLFRPENLKEQTLVKQAIQVLADNEPAMFIKQAGIAMCADRFYKAFDIETSEMVLTNFLLTAMGEAKKLIISGVPTSEEKELHAENLSNDPIAQ